MRPDDIAIIGMACLFPGATSLEEYWQKIKDGVATDTMESTDANQLLAEVAQQALDDAGYGKDATFDVFDAAGASSLGALHLSMRELAAGKSQVVLTRWVDGCVVLKRLADARRDGNRVYAVIKAIGNSANAEAVQAAYDAAGVDPSTIELVAVYGAGLIKAALALYHRVEPPTSEVGARPWVRADDHPRRAAVSAFGMGGSNFHCVLEEAPDGSERTRLRTGGDVQIFAYSGADDRRIAHDVAGDVEALTSEGSDWTAVRAAAGRRRRAFDALAPARLCLVVSRDDDVPAALRQALETLEQQYDKSYWQTPNGPWFDQREAVRSIAALFPGQGSQYVDMMSDVACIADPMIESLDLAESLARASNSAAFIDSGFGALIYPPAAADDDAAERLTVTTVAQPAIGTVSAGLLETLRAFELPIAMAAGHSVGELTALFAAGVFSKADLIRVALRRGALMGPRDDGVERGGMLAVRGGRNSVSLKLATAGIDVTVANDNAPKQVVISGRRSKITRAADFFEETGVSTVPLSVSAGFHSPLVADAEGPFREVLESVSLSEPAFTVVANLTAEPYPADADAIRSTLSRQIASPVRFVESVRAMYDAGARVFLEIGPGRRLCGLAIAILRGADDVSLISCDESEGQGPGVLDLARALAAIAARGVPVRLSLWDA